MILSKKYIPLFLAIAVLLIYGCKSTNISDTSKHTDTKTINQQEIVFKNSKCKDYFVNLSNDRLSVLSNLWLLDHKPVLEITDIPPKTPLGIAVNDGDMQLANYGGIIKGWINFLDKNNNLVVDDIKMKIKIYEWNNLISNNKTLLFSTQRNIVKNNFKLLTYEDRQANEEKNIIALYLDDINLKDFDIKPSECFGEIQINYTNSNGYNFSSNALTLFIDLEDMKLKYITP